MTGLIAILVFGFLVACAWAEHSIKERNSLREKALELSFLLNKANARKEEVIYLLERCTDLHTIAKYDNGVSHNGCNEGEHWARRHYDSVYKYLSTNGISSKETYESVHSDH